MCRPDREEEGRRSKMNSTKQPDDTDSRTNDRAQGGRQDTQSYKAKSTRHSQDTYKYMPF